MIIPLSVSFVPAPPDEPVITIEYRLTCDHEEPDHYCPDHAPMHGFCAGCGVFAVGSFEDSLIPGCCPDCVREMLAEVPASRMDVEVKILAMRQQSGW
jgi:hypothetical protein